MGRTTRITLALLMAAANVAGAVVVPSPFNLVDVALSPLFGMALYMECTR